MIIDSGENKIERIMDTTFSKLRAVIGADTIIGNPVATASGVSVFPISRVTLGFITGGGEYGENKNYDYPFAGGSGTGVSLNPVGFLICDGKGVKLASFEDKPLFEKLLNIAPELVKSILNKNEENK